MACVKRGPMSGFLATSRQPRSSAAISCAQCLGSTDIRCLCMEGLEPSVKSSPARS